MKNLKSGLKFILFFVLVFIFIFSLFNWPAVLINFKYQWQKLSPENQKTNQSYLPQIKSVAQPTAISQGFADNHIIIKKLNIDVPIVWDSSEKDFMANLEHGVVHYQGTAHPGEKSNIFIAGHSSSYWWQRGPYSAIFSVIDKLEQNDEVIITYQNKVFVYLVSEKFVVRPEQVEVMMPTQIPTLTLMTCTPVGTAFRRLIVRAQQVIP